MIMGVFIRKMGGGDRRSQCQVREADVSDASRDQKDEAPRGCKRGRPNSHFEPPGGMQPLILAP